MQTAYRNILIGLVAGGVLLSAGSVTIPNEFTANTTAKASEVNANFTAVKTAVDGNAVDITTNAGNISTKVGSVTVHNTAGITAIRTGDNVALMLSEGFVSISPFAFTSGDDATCYGSKPFIASDQLYKFSASSPTTTNVCWAFAPLTLPDGAKLGTLRCKLFKNDGKTDKGSLKVSFIRGTTEIASVELAQDFNANSWQTQTVSLAGTTVDNEGEPYFLMYSAPYVAGTADGEKDYVGKCIIDYSYAN
jgi:hypothetical protein